MDIFRILVSTRNIIVISIVVLLAACQGSGNMSSNQGSSNLVAALAAPTEFTSDFCVSASVSGADFPTITTTKVYPPGTTVIETVLPNIPVGTNRTVEVGIFENNTCGPVNTADWYGRADSISIALSEVTTVNLALEHQNVVGNTGSVIVRGTTSFENTRLHGEVITGDTTPIGGASCDVAENGSSIGNVVSGTGASDLGVLNTNVQVASSTNQLTLTCSSPGYITATKVAMRVPDPADPTKSTFTATVIMQRGIGIRVTGESTAAMSMEISVPPITLTQVSTSSGQFDRIVNSDNTLNLTARGADNLSKPEVPELSFYVAMPVDNQEPVPPDSLVVEGLQGQTMAARLYPVQGDVRDAAGMNPGDPNPVDDESFHFDPRIYEASPVMITQPVSFRPVKYGTDSNIYEVRIPLVNFDPVKGALTTFPIINVKLTFPVGRCFKYLRTNDSGYVMDQIDTNLEPEGNLYRNLVLNKDLFQKYICPFPIQPIFFGARLIIVTPDQFLTAANNLRIHKQSRGISTRVVPLSEINTSGAPTDAEIKAYLTNAYNNWWIRPKWVLFMGDSEFIPTHYDLHNAWDNAKNAGDIYYGQIGGTALSMPVFGMGRFPVDTNAQAQQMVDNVIAYENSPPIVPIFSSNNYYTRETFAAMFQDNDNNGRAERWFAETSEDIRNYQIGKSMIVERIYNTNSTDPRWWEDGTAIPAYLRKPTFPWNGVKADIINAVNAGTSLLYHRDHGWWWGWGTPSFSTGDLGAIGITSNQYPVVYSVNCASGIFDNETVDLPGNTEPGGYGPSITDVYWAETFVRKADGAIGVIGDTRSSSTTLNNELAKGLFDATWPHYLNEYPFHNDGTVIRKLGDILNHAKGYVESVAGLNNSTQQEVNIYNLLGDPTAEIKSRSPYVISFGNILRGLTLRIPIIIDPPCLTCPPLVEMGPINVVAQDPTNGDVIARGVVVDGAVEFDVSNYTGDINISATGADVIPIRTVVKGASGV